MTRPALARWCLVVVFAAGMAWVEAASVYYLRAMVDRIEPYQKNPLPIHGVLGPVEVVRESATLVMLLTVGILAARTWPRRLGYTAIAFGVWDILYYVFLKIICDWPKSFFDWGLESQYVQASSTGKKKCSTKRRTSSNGSIAVLDSIPAKDS